MAIAALHPSPTPGVEDPVTLEEAAALFAETDDPVSESTLRRWAKADGIKPVRQGQYVLYSDSQILELHARHMFGD
jgi:DNA-binding transcriptional MerR regulator